MHYDGDHVSPNVQPMLLPLNSTIIAYFQNPEKAHMLM